MTPSQFATYRRLCTRADLETLRRNPLTADLLTGFTWIARSKSLLDARAWLLGRLILDLHPDDTHVTFDPSADNSPSGLQPSHSTPLPLQQDIEPACHR
jgi:hypothetical protein